MNVKYKILLPKFCCALLTFLIIFSSCALRNKSDEEYIKEHWPGADLSQFTTFEIMKKSQPYLAVSSSDGYGVYNLFSMKYDIKPTPRCSSITQMNDSVWYMLDLNGNPYREIKLPRAWLYGYNDSELESYAIRDSLDNESIYFIRDIAEEYEPELDVDNEFFMKMYKNSTDAFITLGKMIRSSGCVNTPQNNLVWHQVVKDIIAGTNVPVDTLFKQIDEIIGWYSCGSQSDINSAAYMEQVISQYHQLDEIDSFLKEYPEHYDEYELFSKLETAVMYEWIDYRYEKDHYSSLPMDISYGIVTLLDTVTGEIVNQHRILNGEPVLLHNTQIPEELHHFIQYVDDNPIIEERKVAKLYKEWLELRKEKSSELTYSMQKKYNIITAKIANSLNDLIQDKFVYN